MNKAGLTVLESPNIKMVKSSNYNYKFDKRTGLFVRCGKTFHDDPQMAPAFEILDWELSTSCDNNCAFCYKGNTEHGTTVSLIDFKETIDRLKKLNPIWCQVAYGIGSLKYIPDLDQMLKYTRLSGIIPNITISCLETDTRGIEAIKKECGACAISNYHPALTIETAKFLRENSNLAQVNVHQVLSKETYINAIHLLEIIAELNKVKQNPVTAVVFLWIKPKGRAVSNNYSAVSQVELNYIIDFAMDKGIGIGFDSCSAPMVMRHPDMINQEVFIEPCESTLFSAYLDVHGDFYPCSFTTGISKHDAINIRDVVSISDIWNSPLYVEFRTRLLKSGRSCPSYRLSGWL